MVQCTMLQVISGSKLILRKESTRHHVDLLLSSKHWPLAYAVDMACDVVAHTEVRVPKLAKMMWGDRRGCFEVPKKSEKPKVSCLAALIYSHVALIIFFTMLLSLQKYPNLMRQIKVLWQL